MQTPSAVEPERSSDTWRLSESLERWLSGEGEKTAGSLIELFAVMLALSSLLGV